MLLGFVLFTGESGADPWFPDHSGSCGAAGSNACGTMCFYANCIHCPQGYSGGKNCDPCVPCEDTEETCTTTCTGDGDDEVCTTECECEPCPPPDHLTMDWHGDYFPGNPPLGLRASPYHSNPVTIPDRSETGEGYEDDYRMVYTGEYSHDPRALPDPFDLSPIEIITPPSWENPMIPPEDDDEACEWAGNPYHTIVSYYYDVPRKPDDPRRLENQHMGLCEIWDWRMASSGATGLVEFDSTYYPLDSLVNPTNLQEALIMNGEDLPQYVCRDGTTGATMVPPTVVTIPAPTEAHRGVGPGSSASTFYGGFGLVDWYAGQESSPDMGHRGSPTGLETFSGSDGGTLRLTSVRLTHPPVRPATPPAEPSWQIPVVHLGYSGEEDPDNPSVLRPVHYRWWTYSGEDPTEVYLAAPPHVYLPGESSEGLRSLGKVMVPPGWPGTEVDGFVMPTTIIGVDGSTGLGETKSLGMYSFQLAVRNEDMGGGWEYSNIVHRYVGYEYARRQPTPGSVDVSDSSIPANVVALGGEFTDPTPVPTNWPAGSGWREFDPVPAATKAPTLTPDPDTGLVVRRPDSPRILRIDGQTENRGEAVVYISAYEGLLEYRYWTFNALRPTEFYVPWRSVSFARGDDMEFSVGGLEPAQFYVFEVRAVTTPPHPHPGIRGDASPSHVVFVKEPGTYPEVTPEPTQCFAPCADFPAGL
jgi:hypothetical protein